MQFADDRGFLFRVIHVDERPTYEGWLWLDGYQLDERGQAMARRTIFVRSAGLIRRSLRAERLLQGGRPGGRQPTSRLADLRPPFQITGSRGDGG